MEQTKRGSFGLFVGFAVRSMVLHVLTYVVIGAVSSATAILDRFLHHAEVVSITGRSYRLRHQATGENTAADSKPAIPPTGSRLRKKTSASDGESTQSADSAAATACQA